MSQDREYLYWLIYDHFSLSDLRTICFELGIEDEDARTGAKTDLVLHLISFCQQHERLPDLVAKCREHRPTVDWPDFQLLTGYAAEIRANYAIFWAEHVALSDDAQSPVGRPVESAFSTKSLEVKKPATEVRTADPVDQGGDEQRDPQPHPPEALAGKATELLSPHPVTYAAIKGRLLSAAPGSITLFLAEPGAGKTLWLRYLASDFAGAHAEPDTPIPIYLPLNAYTGADDMESFIRAVLASNQQLPYHQQLGHNLTRVMKRHPLLLLLDGLNEVREPSGGRESQKLRLTRALQAFLANHRAVCLVASRETDFVAGLDWPKIKIQPLDPPGVMRCLDIYAPDEAAVIFRLLEKKNLLGTLTSNPYRVRALCQIYQPGGGLPENAGALFEALVATLVDRERERRADQDEKWVSFDHWVDNVDELAALLTDTEATVSAADELAPPLRDSDAWACAESAGLLSLRNGQLQFSHQQLQEFFAARWLRVGLDTNGLEWDGFSAAVRKRVWDQPFLLLAGIASPALLDSLIQPIAAVDPFLAARCVGVDPARVSAATRQWLANYLARGLDYALNTSEDLTREIVQAAGEMRCVEGLGVLTQPETAPLIRHRVRSDYARAVAQANSPAAADVLIAAIEEEASSRESPWTRPDWHSRVVESARALASMRVPKAQHFLARSLVDGRIYRDILPVVAETDTAIGSGELKALLAHNTFWHFDEAGLFPALTQAAGRVAPRALLPDLLRHVDKPAAVETLLRLGAGQAIIDDYVRRHAHILRQQTWEADARAFGIWYLSHKRGPSELIDLRNYLVHDVGEKAASDFVDLLLKAVTGAKPDHQEPLAALQALTAMRQSRVLPALRTLRAAELPTSPDSWSSYGAVHSGEDLQRLLDDAIAFLEEPRGLGVIDHALDRFALALRGVRAEPDGEALPATVKELLDWAGREPERFERYAAQALEGLAERIRLTDWGVGYEYCHLLRSAAGYLSERGWLELPGTLARLLVTAAESERDHREEWVAAIGEQLIAHGRRGPAPRREIAARLAPLVHRPNRDLQLAAVRVLALIDAREWCGEWLAYLTDRTWPLAYAIVDALGCMTVPAAVREALVAQLDAIDDGERYFAVLGLGSIGDPADLPRVLALGDDPGVEVRRAVLWAVAQLGTAGVADQGVASVLTAGLASPHARLRREAANAAGELRLQALNRELRPLLEDSDLRVVERAAWALGRLADRDSVAPLLAALAGVVYQDDWDSKPGLYQRVEVRLRETIITSLAQIRAGVDKDAVMKHLGREKGLFPALVAGRLDEREPGRPDRSAAARPGALAEEEPAGEPPALDTASRAELETIAWRAADPRQRTQALALLGQEVRDYTTFDETMPRRDPHPEVQLEILRIAARVGHGFWRDRSFTGNPKYDLRLARELSDAGPELALHIPLPAAWRSPTALWLAQRFPDAYALQPLVAALAALLEAPHELDSDQLRALCLLLERRPLARAFLAGQVPWLRWETVNDLLRGDSIWSPSISFLLAQRRVWGIVPRLLEDLSQDSRWNIDAIRWGRDPKRWNLDATEALCELGVYQAGDLIHENLARLEPDKHDDVAVAQVMARVELSGRYGERLPERFKDDEFLAGVYPFQYRPQLLYILSNILAESDDARDFVEGLKLEAVWSEDSEVVNRADSSWLDRRLRRWGQHHLRGLIQALADAGHQDLIEKIGESLMPYDRRHYKNWRAEEIARAVRRCPESLLASWLEDESWAVRWVAFGGLAAAGSAALEEHALRLLEDGHRQILMGLLRRAGRRDGPATRLDRLFRFLQGEDDLGPGDNDATRLHRVVADRLAGDNEGVKRALIAILGQHRSRRFAAALRQVALTGAPETAVVALWALRQIGDRSQAAALRPLLDAPDLEVLAAAIETIAVLRHRPAAARLLELLDHPARSIQRAATGACALMQIRRAVPRLRQRLLALNAPLPTLPDPPEAAPEDEEGDGWSNPAASAAEDDDDLAAVTEFALFLLHATPRLSLGGMDFTAGDGLLALCAFTWYYLPTPLFVGWRLCLNDRGLPYPLSLLPLDDARLITHAMRRDLRAAPWTNRRLRELMLASPALFLKRLDAERFAEDGEGEGWPTLAAPWLPADDAADALVAAVLDAFAPLERRLSEGWEAARGPWAAAVAALDLAALDGEEDPAPDVLWAVVKAGIVDTFDRLLPAAPGHPPRVPILGGRMVPGLIHDSYFMLAELGLSDHDSSLDKLIRAAGAPGDEMVEVDDNLRPLLAVINEDDRQCLIACQDLARLYFTCALLAGWGYSVLHRLRQEAADPALGGAGYEERVAAYLWPEGGLPGGLALVRDEWRGGKKVNPLAFVGE